MSKQTIALLRRNGLLKPLIKSEVINELISNTTLSSEDEQNIIKAYCDNNMLTDHEALKKHLADHYQTEEDLLWNLTQPIKLRKASGEKFQTKCDQHYLKRKDYLEIVTYRLIRVHDYNLCQELYFRIREEEETFSNLAIQYTMGLEKKNGGLVGPDMIGKAHPKLAEAIRCHKEGDLVEPFAIEPWWIIIYIEAYTPSILDEAMKQHMCDELMQAWLAEQVKVQLAQLPDTLSK